MLLISVSCPPLKGVTLLTLSGVCVNAYTSPCSPLLTWNKKQLFLYSQTKRTFYDNTFQPSDFTVQSQHGIVGMPNVHIALIILDITDCKCIISMFNLMFCLSQSHSFGFCHAVPDSLHSNPLTTCSCKPCYSQLGTVI